MANIALILTVFVFTPVVADSATLVNLAILYTKFWVQCSLMQDAPIDNK
jgi:CBS-domain-containing membrane protein